MDSASSAARSARPFGRARAATSTRATPATGRFSPRSTPADGAVGNAMRPRASREWRSVVPVICIAFTWRSAACAGQRLRSVRAMAVAVRSASSAEASRLRSRVSSAVRLASSPCGRSEAGSALPAIRNVTRASVPARPAARGASSPRTCPADVLSASSATGRGTGDRRTGTERDELSGGVPRRRSEAKRHTARATDSSEPRGARMNPLSSLLRHRDGR